MKTSSFWNYTGVGRIIISRGIPPNVPIGYKIYQTLAPTYPFFKDPECAKEEVFRARYFSDILGKLNPKQVYEHLHNLADGAEPVLLCWEKSVTREGEWCHRRMVADWFCEHLGVHVPEYVPPLQPKKPTAQLSFLEELT